MTLSTRARVIAIVLAVFGTIGALSACYGTVGIVSQLAGVEPQIPPTMSASQAEAFLAYMEQAQFIGLIGAFPNILSLFVSIFMVVAGVMTLSSGRIGMAPFACFGAALVDVIVLIVQIITFALLWPYLDGFMAAIIPPGEPEVAEMVKSMTGFGMALGGTITVVVQVSLAAFWGWAGMAMRSEEQLMETLA